MRFITLLALIVSAAIASAQTPANSPRLTAPISDSQRVTLTGNVPFIAQPQFDQGELSPSTPMQHMRLVLSRTPVQEAALESFMAEQLDRNSPNYRNWLTPAQFAANYGANIDDIHTIVTWLQEKGFSLDRIDSGHMSIAFSGTVEQVESAFHTQIHQFTVNDNTFLSNITDPQIPAALAPVVKGIARLNTIHPKPLNQPASPGKLDDSTHKFIPVEEGTGLNPELTNGCPGSCFLFVTPQDAATIYNSPISSAFPGTSSNNGNGITIGIGGDATIKLATFWKYRSAFLNETAPAPATPTTEPCGPADESCTSTVAITQQGLLKIFNVDHVLSTSDTDEAYIDTELSGGIAPGANVYFYTSNDLNSAIEQMLNDNFVNVFSLSFGNCEQANGTSGNQQINGWWQQAAAQGISVFVSTGDSGSAGCDYDKTTTTGGLAVNGFASTPYDVGVGGTDFDVLATNFSTYVSSTNNSTYQGSALSFIPEATWNNSTTVNTTYLNNKVYTGQGATAGSGGISSCITMTGATCTAGYPKPSWQSAPGVPADGVRDIPDVSLFAANGVYNATWAICTDDIYSGKPEDCASGDYIAGFGGTSTSSPATAGIFALLAQSQGGSVGLPNPELYKLATSTPTVFNDTTVGNNSVPCNTAPIPAQCVTAASGKFLAGYNTDIGYDLATGIGSLNITNLINNWAADTGSNAASIVITPNPTTPKPGVAFTIGVSVNGSTADGGAPTGTVALMITNSTNAYNGSFKTLTASTNDGIASFTVPSTALPAGTYTVSIRYNGDSNYSEQVATISLIISSLPSPAIVITPSANPIFVNQSVNIGVSVNGSTADGGAPTGNVSMTIGAYHGVSQTLTASGNDGTASFTVPANSLAVGTDTITVSYLGDTNYVATSNTASLVVNSIPLATVTFGAVPANLYQSATLPVTVTVTGTGTPTGTVTLTSGSYSSGAQPLVAGALTNFTIPAWSLASGSDTITATYNGDSNNGANTGTSTSITVTASTFTYTESAVTLTAGASTSNTSTITVTPSGQYAGTVNYTAAITASPAGAVHLPTFTYAPTGGLIFTTASSAVQTGTITITTISNAAAKGPIADISHSNWYKAAGGTILASFLIFCIPGAGNFRKRYSKLLMTLCIVLAASFTIFGCGSSSGGGGGGGGGGGSNGTTTGTYTITVTATGTETGGTGTVKPATTTFTLTVN